MIAIGRIESTCEMMATAFVPPAWCDCLDLKYEFLIMLMTLFSGDNAVRAEHNAEGDRSSGEIARGIWRGMWMVGFIVGQDLKGGGERVLFFPKSVAGRFGRHGRE